MNLKLQHDISKEIFIEGPLPVGSIHDIFGNNHCGSRVTFSGIVRPDQKGELNVIAIDFEIHLEIAEREIEAIISEGKKRYGIVSTRVWHSFGRIQAGETCFFVMVESKHRNESFEALKFVVDEVKKRCPIFGKEILENGKHVWKKNIG